MVEMTKQEARAIATAMNKWRRAGIGKLPMPSVSEFWRALDVLTQPSTIAGNIRNAATCLRPLGDVESQLAFAFMKDDETYYSGGTPSIEWRWFLLFVAEALES